MQKITPDTSAPNEPSAGDASAGDQSAVPSSFRDPSGFLFFRNGKIYRQVNSLAKEDYDLLMSSGLYDSLVGDGLLIPHEEVGLELRCTDDAHKILAPEMIRFISYPYEWCFSQFKDAALATLAIQKRAFEFGMCLKDASAYNIQFVGGRPVLIDTLSFEKYREGHPWIAYRQFCQHFLAPLALMSYADIRLNQLMRVYIDGIPLDLASSLLSLSTRFRFSLLSHIHLHARSQRHFGGKAIRMTEPRMPKTNFMAVIDSLESATGRLKWRPRGTEWGDYYEDTNYSDGALDHKRELVARFLDRLAPDSVWDLGANTGFFSRVSSGKGIPTMAFDIDPVAVEKNYRECVEKSEGDILPLLLDLTNPSSGIGWENRERMSLLERGPADTVLALALIHHLAISNNVPLEHLAGFFSRTCRSLIIEFVPKSDSQAQRLLATREDIFPDYKEEAFERAFERYFEIKERASVGDSERTLYCMEKRADG